MRFRSTRGRAPELGFADVLLAGLADDGGLYLPTEWPQLGELDRLRGRPYAEVAVEVMWPFVAGDIERDAFETMVHDSYATFGHPDVVPVRPLDDRLWLAELFWGPTIAFKDVALQLVGRLFDHVLGLRDQRVTILGATSGDTGSAAIEGCRGRDRISVFILFPDGRVSEVQRRQMTTVVDPNVFALAVTGTFDDCQDLVKAAFGDTVFRSEVGLSAVNSINWARVMAQVVYYVTAHLAVSPDGGPVSYCVPSGNFGNVFAGWVAKQMGLPIDRLVVASNRNDILARFLASGEMTAETVVPTTSPSMDIQVSSNFERLLFEALDRNPDRVTELLGGFRATGTMRVSPDVLDRIRADFDGGRLGEDEVAETMARWNQAGVLLDPHTAVGVGVAERLADPAVPMVCLATAHPAKFPDAVEAATGVRPALPAHLHDLLDRPEHFEVVPDDLSVVEDFVRRHRPR